MMRLTDKQLHSAYLTVALLALEAAPVQVWLIVWAVTQQGDLARTLAPIWLLVIILALFAGCWRLLIHWGVAALLISWVVVIPLSFLALARFSPLLYGASNYPFNSWSWLGSLGSGRFDGQRLFVAVALLGYLAWRGSVTGAPNPFYSVVARRFWIGLGAIVLALFGALAARHPSDEIAAVLMGLLALEGVAGLSALALSRPASGSLRNDAQMPGSSVARRWQGLAVLLAVGVTLVALLLGSLLDLRVLQGALSWLGLVGAALNVALYWLIQGLDYALYLISLLFSKLFPTPHLPTPQPPHKNTPPKTPQKRASGSIGGALETTIVVAGVILAIIVVVVVVALIARAIANARKQSDDDVDEERESLEAQGLWQRGEHARRRVAIERDALSRAGVRWRYREVMRAGARVGVIRRPSETADEYTTRLAAALHATNAAFVDSDLLALVQTYDAARYSGGDDGDPPASAEQAAIAERTLSQIRAARP